MTYQREEGCIMSKQIKFTDSDYDKALIKKIAEYQKSHGLSSFIAAVRKLCEDAIQVEKITH